MNDDVPVDGLQHAGSALLRAEPSDVLATNARSLIEALRDRNWTGDTELIAELEHYADHTAPDLIALPVALDELGEALDQSAGSEAFIDVTNGALWPAQLFDVDQGPVDFDPGSDRWLLVVGLGSLPAYETMRRFVATIQQPDLASRLTDALGGSGAFRRFHTELSRHERESRAGIGSATMLAWVERVPGSPNTATNPILSCDTDLTDPTTRIVLAVGSSVRCEDVAVPRTPATCVVCHRLRGAASFNDAGDVFICTECQANAKQFIEIQDSIWAEIPEPSDSSDQTDKPADP